MDKSMWAATIHIFLCIGLGYCLLFLIKENVNAIYNDMLDNSVLLTL